MAMVAFPDSTSRAFSTRPAELAGDAVSIASVWEESLPAFRDGVARERLESVYRSNPAGEGLLSVLEGADGRIAGVQGVVPRIVCTGGTPHRWGALADLAVRPAHRSLGPALQLVGASLRQGESACELLYGSANRKSGAVFRRAGLEPGPGIKVFRRPIHVGRLNAGHRWIRRVPPLVWFANGLLRSWGHVEAWWFGRGVTLEVRNDITDDVDVLWGRGARCRDAARAVPVMRRSADDLRWRFRRELARSDFRVIYARDRSTGSCEGYLVLVADVHGATILDLYTAGSASVFKALLHRATLVADRAGAAVVTLEFSGPPVFTEAIRAAGFFLREDRPVYLRASSPESRQAFERAYFTSFDWDPS